MTHRAPLLTDCRLPVRLHLVAVQVRAFEGPVDRLVVPFDDLDSVRVHPGEQAVHLVEISESETEMYKGG